MMLGQAVSMVLPKVVGYKLTGCVEPYITSTDVVLTITKVKVKSLSVIINTLSTCSLSVEMYRIFFVYHKRVVSTGALLRL